MDIFLEVGPQTGFDECVGKILISFETSWDMLQNTVKLIWSKWLAAHSGSMRGGNSLLTCKSFENKLLQQLEVNIPARVALDDGGKNGGMIRHTSLERCLEVDKLELVRRHGGGELFREGGADVLCPGRELPGLDVEQLDAAVGERQDTTNGRGRGRGGDGRECGMVVVRNPSGGVTASLTVTAF
ncbi:hypothetical protein DFH08DRAFT_812086 [Mycena albidolilacea]|uniref:Uncharacterized protein n=1 Tax=Mycena albidolilacea TaxID=1033008 RepID=A0AAD7EM99_9AGAR|nr:hypothetical protein DFH08DRAFT_812086 [Mycena albidolilacea]